MCTVTVVPRGESGFRLVCNRDERLERAIAKAPQLMPKGRRTAVYPIDPVSGGTWVGVNDSGLAIAILNRHPADRPSLPERATVSRGVIVPGLLAESDAVDGVIRTVGALRLERFEPFTLVAICRQQVAALSSDGEELSLQRTWLTRPMLFTSSSLGDERVEGPRRRLFEHVLGTDRSKWLDAQTRFHRHRWPDRPHISVHMERADAATVSRSTVDVSCHGLRFCYEDLRAERPTARVA
jgi:hypothetical protein